MSPDVEAPPIPAFMAQPKAGTVLVVDDAPDTLRMLCDALAGEGYTVLVARDGPQALARLDVVTPDAILLDGVMPGWSGFETCQRIKAHPVGQAIPVIFMTGLSDTTDVVTGFEVGGVDYVVKPIRIEEFDAYAAANPLAGMPYGLPGLSTAEHRTLQTWLANGAPIAAEKPLTASLNTMANLIGWDATGSAWAGACSTVTLGAVWSIV